MCRVAGFTHLARLIATNPINASPDQAMLPKDGRSQTTLFDETFESAANCRKAIRGIRGDIHDTLYFQFFGVILGTQFAGG